MSKNRFPDVPTGYPFPDLEQEVLELWKERDTFQKSMKKTAPQGEFVLYEGPPTANNVPHVGHVASRVAKDLFPRYRTMRGYHVARKAGWDTHGLPVEIEVEKRLGFSGKQEIERYGIAEFNRACLDSVSTYEKQWRAMTERVGYWTDLDAAYYTYTNQYIESVWWALSELWKKNLLEQGYKIQPYCSRCGTTLSSHEVAQNYKDVEDPSVWVRFPLRPGQEIETLEGETWRSPASPDALSGGASLIAWTTTPWTLLAHVGLVVHRDLVYRVTEDPTRAGGLLVFGDQLDSPMPMELDDPDQPGKRKRIDLRDLPAIARFKGSALVDARYDRPYGTDLGAATAAVGGAPSGKGGNANPASSANGSSESGAVGTVDDEAGFRVTWGDYVTATAGSGMVHTAPLFGEDDYKTGRREGFPLLRTITAEGRVADFGGLEDFAGLDFKEADPKIVRELKERGLLVHTERYLHPYPFCWRCDRPLLYYATESWFVATTQAQSRIQELNKTIAWHPDHVGAGRFGKWLETMVDWALSRKRYWGTPLPVWQCDGCPETRVPGSYAELFEMAGRELPDDVYDPAQFDPHRPHIDDFTAACSCGGTLRRVEEVIDAWFDSGSMPFAQHHYPFENQELFRQQFPANYISEGVDQTRGWFYTLHVLGALLFDSVAYQDCIVLGHINDDEGRKMSKRLGNVVDPMEVMQATGADALRWYLCINNPEIPARFSERLVREAAQNFLIPLWNAVSFFSIYANLDGWRPRPAAASSGAAESKGLPTLAWTQRPALDRWILLRLDRLVSETTAHLDGYQIVEASRGLQAFVEDLTNWYIRRSRGRFWSPSETAQNSGQESGNAKQAAYETLYEVLTTYARLIAPFTPFVAEAIYQRLTEGVIEEAPESVHLVDWPELPGRQEANLETAMAAVQRIVRFGHAARNSHGLKTRQPLASVTVVSADGDLAAKVEPYLDLVCDELNVKEVLWAADRSVYVHSEVKPLFPRLGPRYGKQMKAIAAALAAADGDELAARFDRGESLSLDLGSSEGGDERPVEIGADDVEIRLIERRGTATEGDRELLVALDTELTPELVDEGKVREVVNRIQAARKQAALDYADRIHLRFQTSDELATLVDRYRDLIAGETLATEIERVGDGAGSVGLESTQIDEEAFAFALVKV